MEVVRLSEHEWRAREAAHAARVDALTAGHRERRASGERHPVQDFLFEYYGHTPARLRRWHPGPEVVLEAAAGTPRARWTHYARDEDTGDVWLDTPAFVAARSTALHFTRRLLTATLERPMLTGCFGLHEWAMVYRQPAERRHASWPLRLGADGTDAVVESHTLRCTHFDAFRFFTDDAVPRNAQPLSRASQVDDEQPGCVHAGMDVYRWAFKLAPAVPSELVADAFALAAELRTLDMQASPYDLRALGYAPVAIETPDGKREYAARQRELGERANALRRRLLSAIDAVDVAAQAPVYVGPPATTSHRIARPAVPTAATSAIPRADSHRRSTSATNNA
ncbi:MAG: 3-methyladenine DNA glycosylase [Baekduiaceae bacterium]